MVKGSDLKVDKEKCISCGACISAYEQLFKFADDGKAEVIESGECEDCSISDVIGVCPHDAIKKIKD